jgi:uncharacterized protein YbjQ (UPF0145 family)
MFPTTLKLTRPALGLLAVLALASCAAHRPPHLTAADPVLVFQAGTSVNQPVQAVLGQVRSLSCTRSHADGAADGDALSKLKGQAARRGANGLTDVEIDHFSMSGSKNPCWRGSRASGTAVLFAARAAVAAK